MKRLVKPGVLLLAIALVAVACGDDGAAPTTVAADGRPAIAGQCAEDTLDCDDTLIVGDEPADEGGVEDVEPGAGVIVDGGLPTPEALATDATGVLAVRGFYFEDESGARLCELLAESLPPLCGGTAIPLADSNVGIAGLKTEQGVAWTDQAVVLLGELIDGTFHPTSTSI